MRWITVSALSTAAHRVIESSNVNLKLSWIEFENFFDFEPGRTSNSGDKKAQEAILPAWN